VNWFSAHYEWVVGVVLLPIILLFIKHQLDASRKTADRVMPQSQKEDTILQLQKENMELRQALDAAESKLRIRDSIEKGGPLFYKRGETEPLCPVCWQRDAKVVYLPPSYTWNGGVRRDCQVCRQTSWEVPMQR
jgi:hypothetical protein